MNNLFSVFDPVASFSLNANWISGALALMIIPGSFWLRNQAPLTLMKNLHQAIHGEFRALLGPNSVPGLSLIPLSLLMFIMVNNFMGLFPFVFTASSHLTFSLSMALPLWLGHVILSWGKETGQMLAHLVPLGTPAALMPFMVLIELVSNLIRPITLSVRLAANMVAGHLLLTLLGNQSCAAPAMVVMMVLMALILLLTLESAVALIQAYVFTVLSTLYLSEVNFKSLS